MSSRKRILFLCTGNSCRSQMAEAWTRALKGSEYEAYSAGVEVKALDPRAVKAMAEVGIDMSMQKAKHIDSVADREFDYVITLCSHAQETCPFFPARTKLLHKGFDDPPVLAANASSEDEAMHFYRRVRDEIRDFVSGFPETLEQS
ncbi:MAG: arsenate reductase ArsC [Desulfomonilaceae bacterium]